jgi:hypothetical protein
MQHEANVASEAASRPERLARYRQGMAEDEMRQQVEIRAALERAKMGVLPGVLPPKV